MKKPIKSYVRAGNPIASASQNYIDQLLENARRMKDERQLLFNVGETVWCVFSGTPEGEVNPGTVIRVEIDTRGTVYTVLPDGSVDYETFTGRDIGKTIFSEHEEDMHNV